MFMIPMPPTSRLTPAMEASRNAKISVDALRHLHELTPVHDHEVVVLAGADLVLAAQDALDVDHAHLQRHVLRDLRGQAPQPVLTENTEFGGGQRNEHAVVRFRAEALADLLENADDLERYAVDGERATDQIFGRHFEVLGYLAAEHDDASARGQVALREHRPDVYVDGMHGREVRRRADHIVEQVLVAELDLATAGEFRDDFGKQGRIADQRLVVVDRERNAVGGRDAPPERLAGHDREHPGTELVDLLVHGALCTRAERHHRDHRGDADDDAEHRQARTQQVGDDRRQCDPDCLDD